MRRSSVKTLKALVGIVTTIAVIQVAWATAPSGRYIPGSCSGGVIYDTKTKLLWQQYPGNNPPQNWTANVDYCKSVTQSGKTWRTPTVKELATLVDYSALPDGGSAATVDQRVFGQGAVTVWSSTPDPSGALVMPPSGGAPVPSAYAVDFATGHVVLRTVDSNFATWCVSDDPPQTTC